MRVAILTVSDAGFAGRRRDGSGDAIAEWAAARGYDVAARSIVPDDSDRIVAALAGWCDADAADVVLTTGGTGLAPRDVTPEATRAVIERETPGLSELVRVAALPTFPRAALSRGVSGVRGRTLVVNLPGSTSGVRDGLRALQDVLIHAVDVLRGAVTDHDAPGLGAEGKGS